MYKSVKAISVGTLALSTGIVHFDPNNDAEDGRYLGGIVSDADADKLVKRGIVKIVGDATEQDYKLQQAGFPSTGRVREFGAQAVEEASQAEEEASAGLMAGGTAVATANLRAHPVGAGPDSVSSGGDDDAPPAAGGRGAASGGAPANDLPATLKQNADKVIEAVGKIDDVAELDTLLAAEKGRGEKARSTVVSGIEARKAELAK